MELKSGSGQDENWRILIVEDDERLANLTKDYLESNGLKVSIEGDGSRAIERIKTEQPDLVVLDLMLPGEDGLAVWLDGNSIDLTSAEFDLLWLLSSSAGHILTREEIFHQLRGIEYDGQDRSIDVRVSRIRPKVGDDPINPKRIKTVRSKGYLFVKEI